MILLWKTLHKNILSKNLFLPFVVCFVFVPLCAPGLVDFINFFFFRFYVSVYGKWGEGISLLWWFYLRILNANREDKRDRYFHMKYYHDFPGTRYLLTKYLSFESFFCTYFRWIFILDMNRFHEKRAMDKSFQYMDAING